MRKIRKDMLLTERKTLKGSKSMLFGDLFDTDCTEYNFYYCTKCKKIPEIKINNSFRIEVHCNGKNCNLKHREYSIEDFVEYFSGNKASNRLFSNKLSLCEKCKKENSEYFCLSCEEELCVKCFEDYHSRHQHKNFSQIIKIPEIKTFENDLPKVNSQLFQQIEIYKTMLFDWETKIKEIKKFLRTIEDDNKQVREYLKSLLDSYLFSKDSPNYEILTNLKNNNIKKILRINKVRIENTMGEIFSKMGEFCRPIGETDNHIIGAEYINGNLCACKNECLDEVQILLGLDHPNIVQLYGYMNGKMMMEFGKGGDFEQLLFNYKIDNKFKIYILKEIASGLKYLHDNGIIHGDLKLKNIILNEDYNPLLPNKYPVPKLIDFGLSVKLKPGEVETKDRGFTENYVSPEVKLQHKISKASDIFSFGLVMFKVFTGYPPKIKLSGIKNRVEENIKNYLQNELKPSLCPVAIKNIILNCCKYNPKERINSELLKKNLEKIYLLI